MSVKILCVDDDANILAGYQRGLRKQFALDIAVGPEAGLAAMKASGPYAVIVADMRMPGMDGIQFLAEVEGRSPDTVRIMLTGNADQKTAMDAVNHGHVFRFLTKPCPPEMLALTLDAGLKQHRLVTAEKELLEQTLQGSVKTLTEVLSVADSKAFGLGQVLRDHMQLYTGHLNCPDQWELLLAAMLSQIGYVTVPPAVVHKMRSGLALLGEERAMLARVPETGAQLLANIPRLENVARIVRYKDKRFDGVGLPADGVKGDELPIGSRILKVLSDMTEYEARGFTKPQALKNMQERAGWYDPRVLDAAFACFDVYLAKPTPEVAREIIGLAALRTGHLLLSDVLTKDGILIAPAGTRVSPMLLEKLDNFAHVTGVKEPIHVARLG